MLFGNDKNKLGNMSLDSFLWKLTSILKQAVGLLNLYNIDNILFIKKSDLDLISNMPTNCTFEEVLICPNTSS